MLSVFTWSLIIFFKIESIFFVHNYGDLTPDTSSWPIMLETEVLVFLRKLNIKYYKIFDNDVIVKGMLTFKLSLQ